MIPEVAVESLACWRGLGKDFDNHIHTCYNLPRSPGLATVCIS